jgi:general secretion pathway protein D
VKGRRFFEIAVSCLFVCTLLAEEVVSSDVESAQAFNHQMIALKSELRSKFEQVKQVSQEQGSETEYQQLLSDIREIRESIRKLEEHWQRSTMEGNRQDDEPYAMWDIGETTLSQLVMEYGSSDFLYVIPPELSGMKISLFSGIPLPHESWSEMIDMILAQNGVGVKRVNAFVKQLYILKLDPSAVEAVVGKEAELELFPSHARLCYVFSPSPEQLKSTQSFFERFSDPKQAMIQAIGSKVAIVATRGTIEKLLGLYHAVWENGQGKTVRIVNLTKISAQEAEKVLKAAFSDGPAKTRPAFYPSGADELISLVLPQGLVLVGELNTVERAQKILNELECQLEDPSEKIIYWYTCKHSNPEDIAKVLESVYESLNSSNIEKKSDAQPSSQAATQPYLQNPQAPTNPAEAGSPFPYIAPGSTFNPVMPATAPFIQPGVVDKNQKSTFGNFIVDNKTTSILMVVRREELPKIKSLLRRMDVPKRMVQLDVLLVEKKLHDNREMGIDLLQFGSNSSGKRETSFNYNADSATRGFKKGLMNFIYSKPNGDFPAMDLKFNFLLAQEDVRIKANPSVLAINQTPAQISIVEEISINNGAFPINTPSGVVVEKSFTRAQYGITINLTPTVHLDDESDDKGFVSLVTDLEFDTTKIISADDRPPVTRRHIENEVRVADGETIILGGLRQKIEEDNREKIPFLGDLPGIGKLFGTTRSRDISTEMFIFITPRIIRDPIEDLRVIRQEEYRLRPGDIPEFLACIDEAKENERKKLFGQSLKLLLDMY